MLLKAKTFAATLNNSCARPATNLVSYFNNSNKEKFDMCLTHRVAVQKTKSCASI